MTKGVCRIPVTAQIEIINGEAVMVDAKWEEIPAADIARYFVEKLGSGFFSRCRPGVPVLGGFSFHDDFVF